ncbi:hypothetical protein [Tenacibaculum piscium]|uniref:hypothetical protein n=1 Tax=Tenacibaculum piscium TaxID=1458515 RepID=UPI00187B4526|nr:hypothetical protein [Tenacibaculum piscium]MBE7691271.1 hypothetical protein [Tenacibaculum piscium]
MLKVISITVKNRIADSTEKYDYNDFKELNELLNDEWSLNNTETINNNVNSFFTMVFYLSK